MKNLTKKINIFFKSGINIPNYVEFYQIEKINAISDGYRKALIEISPNSLR